MFALTAEMLIETPELSTRHIACDIETPHKREAVGITVTDVRPHWLLVVAPLCTPISPASLTSEVAQCHPKWQKRLQCTLHTNNQQQNDSTEFRVYPSASPA